jgi:hypothetical protein
MTFNIGLNVYKRRKLGQEIRGYFTNRISPGVSEFNGSFRSTEGSVKPDLKEDEKKNGRRDSQGIKTKRKG